MLCNSVYNQIERVVEYEIMWGSPLKRHYGVASGDMTLKRFLRSIFLVFTTGASFADGHFPEVTVATVKWHYCRGGDGCRSRMKAIYRFRMPNNEQVEISMENKSMFIH